MAHEFPSILHGGAAFPCSPGDVAFWNEGMSLRDWFAGKVLAGAAVYNQPLSIRDGENERLALIRHWAGVAEAAYIAADAMLAARQQEQSHEA